MATEKLGFTDREAREAKIRELKAESRKHIHKYSTHEGNEPRILYVVAWDEPSITVAQEKTDENSKSVGPVS